MGRITHHYRLIHIGQKVGLIAARRTGLLRGTKKLKE
jgi:hypothetical protein